VPLTIGALLASSIAGPERLGVASRAWIVLVAAQVLLWGLLRPAIEPVLAAAASREEPFGRYRGVFEVIEGARLEAPRLRELRDRFAASGARASVEMRALERAVGFAELRHSGLVHFVANVVLLYDVWCALALERWRGRAGARVRGWLEALGEVEALASFGAFARENPAYAFPEVTAGPPRYDAEGLAHPLLPRASRVANDVRFGEGGPRALLVTGSNMAGKSTLLRAVGVNAVLALAGAPVCASRLALSVAAVRTSMRVSDSLEQGISHFYAELARLRGVLDATRGGREVLFLLDEILHGTNSRERQIGAKAIVKRLVELGAIGAVSSHDLGLAALEDETAGRVRNVHFEERVEGGKMTFDYRLRSGAVTTGNALRLMRLVGLEVDLPEEG
jgi:hypothetical protein